MKHLIIKQKTPDSFKLSGVFAYLVRTFLADETEEDEELVPEFSLAESELIRFSALDTLAALSSVVFSSGASDT